MTNLTYQPIADWGRLPAGLTYRDVSGIGVDSRDRVYVLTRLESRVIVFERGGQFIGTFGEGLFTDRTHGLFIGPEDAIFCVDDGNHTVQKFSPEGRLLMTLGTAGKASDTGYEIERGVESIVRGGPPFNRCTDLAVAPNGDLYVSDGYGNARVHRFSADGQLLQSWGEPGTAAGQFNLPHGVCIARDGRVFVADRENDRIQIFSPVGEFLEQWTNVQRPTGIRMDPQGLIYVSELAWFPGNRSFVHGVFHEKQPGRVTVFDPNGAVLVRMGESVIKDSPIRLWAPHTICADSKGDIYVGEVVYSFGGMGKAGLVPQGYTALHKFSREALV
jgi:hypothetical protein